MLGQPASKHLCSSGGGIGYGASAHAADEFTAINPRPGSNATGLAKAEIFYADLLPILAAK